MVLVVKGGDDEVVVDGCGVFGGVGGGGIECVVVLECSDECVVDVVGLGWIGGGELVGDGNGVYWSCGDGGFEVEVGFRCRGLMGVDVCGCI